MKLMKWIADTFIHLAFAWLAVDILYLYYNGAWYDPTWWIEAVEVTMLYCFVVYGLARGLYTFGRLYHD